jgi:hypothetical protein
MVEQELRPTVTPRGGVAGTEVRVRMSRLPPNMAAVIGFGGIGSPHEILAQTESDAQGELVATVRVPAWVERDRAYLFYWGPGDMRPAGFSEPFVITGPDGVVRLSGSLGRGDDGCRTLHGEAEAMYALSGEIGSAADGARVVVEATVAEAPSCGGRTTLVVRAIGAG